MWNFLKVGKGVWVKRFIWLRKGNILVNILPLLQHNYLLLLLTTTTTGIIVIEVHTGFLCGDLREENHLLDLGVDGRLISR
jgi:hypothetical protein